MSTELRLRTRVGDAELERIRGKLVGSGSYDVVLTGPTKVLKPNGAPLCVYIPGRVTAQMDAAYEVLHSLRNERTDNRGDASGTERAKRGDQARTRSSLVASAVVGAVDPGGIYTFCRLTSWTGQHLPEFEALHPLLQEVSYALEVHVPDRWAAQAAAIAQCHPEWVIPGTVFTTVTVNNTYSTGMHTDKGDFEAGFSTLAVCRRGSYTGGLLVFGRYRVAVDMQHGDLLLLDAHEPHGNTVIEPTGSRSIDLRPGATVGPPAERISLVAYMRAAMTECGDEQAELAKALAAADRRSAKGVPTGA